MSGDIDPSHPARQVDLDRLKRELAKRNEKVPAITARGLSTDYPVDHKQQALGNNLEDLADEGEICSFFDGHVNIYWIPRDSEEGGKMSYSELLDDSIDWDEIDVNDVPLDVAKEIASERVPFYRPRSFWSTMRDFSQIGIIAAFGLVVLGLGGLVAGSFGLGQNTSALILQWGLRLSLLALLGWVVFMILEILASQGRVPIDPRSRWRDSE